MAGNDLKRAAKLYHAGKYSQAIQVLEAQVFRYRESFRFFYVLGMSCLYTGDFGGAYSYLHRALNIKPSDTAAQLGLAVVYLRRGETQEALKIWFNILDRDPKNRQAARGLKLLKRHIEPDAFVEFTESKKIHSLLPKDRTRRPYLTAALLIAVLGLSGIFAFPYLIGFYTEMTRDEPRQNIAALDLSVESYQSSEVQERVRFRFEEEELRSRYRRIIDLFHEYRDNLAQREINRLQLSNASPELKQKLTLLEEYIRTPSFGSLQTEFRYREVAENPQLYEDCYVIWKGRVSNLSVGRERISFDLLVGYETEQVVEGIVPVELDYAVQIDPAFPIEILGRIETSGNSFKIMAHSVHQFSMEEKER
jgi:tetratricopeptide (TPR) repeat protein